MKKIQNKSLESVSYRTKNFLKSFVVTSIVLTFVFFGGRAACEESFVSMKELRSKLSDPGSYGASENELLWFKQFEMPHIYECRIYSTETKVDDKFAYSTGAIAGRRIIKELKRYSGDDAKNLFSVVGDYENYGDLMIGEFKPNMALEIISGRSTFVINYCSKSYASNISSVRVDADGVAERWSKVVLASPTLRKIFEVTK